ncbi:MAG: hypothetical protein OXG27_15885 [Chloroflexi bacterium]|nr:hypothetical protein [Chloroflexota bacterium]
MPDEANEDAPQRERWQGHNHAAFVLEALSGYRLRRYVDRKVHRGRLGSGIRLWGDDDQLLAIEEGRRQLHEQFLQLQHIIRRASVLLPVGLAISVFLLTGLDGAAALAQPSRTIVRVVLLAGAVMTSWGTLVMGALIGGRSSLRRTDTLQLTETLPGLRRYLARDYADNVATGENATAARLTHLGTGVTWIVVGALVGAVGLALSHWQPEALPSAQPQCCVVECCDTGIEGTPD